MESILQNGEESKKIAILDIEIENLKPINDTFGHAVGDTGNNRIRVNPRKSVSGPHHYFKGR
ncbi:MAG: diguanylate cyclase domain-containing protein [Saccharofermentanales bacterium]